MGVFLTGATGVLGGRLVERLADRDHEVIGLVRDDDDAALVEARGGVPRYGDVLDPGSLKRVVQNVAIGTVVHAATALPVENETERGGVGAKRSRSPGGSAKPPRGR